MDFLIDYNLTGDAFLLLKTLEIEGWLGLTSIQFLTFKELKLPMDSSDRVVWDFAQYYNMILLTANRNMKGPDSLEQTMREKNTPMSLPIMTIGNPDRMDENNYRQKCAARLVEIILDLNDYRGVGRVFIP